MAPNPISAFKIKQKNLKKQAIIQKVLDHHKNILDEGTRFHPRIIHLETRSRCNSRCSFCAASVQNETRPDIHMSDELIDKILGELKEINYSNRLSFYCNNEPFIEKRIYDIVAKSRKMLPDAYLEIKTNGRALSIENVHKIFESGLDMLYINDYREPEDHAKGKHSKKVQTILDHFSKSRRFKGHFENGYYHSRLMASVRNMGEVLGNRAGTSPNGNKIETLQKYCLRPFEMLTINPKGEVALCSEDLYFAEPMGNVNANHLLDIFHSDDYKNVRRELLQGNRGCKSTCQVCDYKGMTDEVIQECGFSDYFF